MIYNQPLAQTDTHPEAEVLRLYAEAMPTYSPLADALRVQLDAGTPPNQIEGYLGSGAEKHVFRATTSEGQAVVIKTLQPEAYRTPPEGEATGTRLAERIAIESAPLIANHDADPTDNAFEQLLAVSPREGLMVTS